MPLAFARTIFAYDIADEYLLPHERSAITLRRHPAILIDAFAFTGISVLISSLLSADVIPGGAATSLAIAWGVSLIALLYLVTRLAIWSGTVIVATSVRIMLIGGLRERKITIIPLARIWDMTIHRSLLARLLGYGTFVIEFAPGQGVRKINFVPYPEQVYLELVELMFPASDESDVPGEPI